MTFVAALMLAAASVPVMAAKPGWSDKFEESKKAAAENKKHVLLFFTGSDWCIWCKHYDKEVFSKKPFQDLAAAQLVLVEIDAPQSIVLPDELEKQNVNVKADFKVEGVPTIILLNPEGKEIKRWNGYNAKLVEEIQTAITGKKAGSGSWFGGAFSGKKDEAPKDSKPATQK